MYTIWTVYYIVTERYDKNNTSTLYRVFHKSRPHIAKSSFAITIVPHLAHIIINLLYKLCLLQNAIIFNSNAVAIMHTYYTTDRIYIDIMLRLMKIKHIMGVF